ncbi:hypothetical protein LZL87_014243 [Fusarium oxysporum]|nr:hypothetical protein LZL87_014243 [Fusarium oxysporum]
MDVVTKALDANVPAMSEIFDFLPVPTLVVSPSYRIQRASAGLLEAWGRKREELIDQDLFIALYQGSLTERFHTCLYNTTGLPKQLLYNNQALHIIAQVDTIS